MLGEVSRMAATRKEIADLKWQHEAIKSNMKFLTKLLSNLAKQSNRWIVSSVQLKKQISLYRWLFYGFQEVVRQHIELDESVFKTIYGSTLTEEIILEHEEIKNQVDNVIRLAENAVNYELRREVLNKCALDISEGVKRIRELIEAHMAKEDISLKKV
jgi:hypothetical protein